MARLKLLYEVPFSYLVTEEAVLPPESIRFFYLDENWIQALVQGALSLGQVCAQDVVSDRAMQQQSMPMVRQMSQQIRLQKMHENHKKGWKETSAKTKPGVPTGFLIRSVLVRRMRGLEITGKCGETVLAILRMETLADDCLICIFDGELTDLVIAEPQTGLKFGTPDDTRVVKVRSISDDESFGSYLKDVVDVNLFTKANGKIEAAQLARRFGSILGQNIGAAELAFELIATAHRAELIKK